MKVSLKSKKTHIFIIVLLTFLVYLNTLNNGFVWDDNEFILGWDDIRDFEFSKLSSTPEGHPGVYRPVRYIAYTISYQLFKLNPFFHHLQALFIHLACTILLYFITIEIAKKRLIAFMASLLFGVHPVHTEAISYVTASYDILGVVFFLAAFYLYIKRKYIYSVIFALLAFFNYEIALVLPIMIILYDICFKKSKNIKMYAIYFAATALYFIARFSSGVSASRGTYLGESFYLTMLTMTKAFVRYISITVFPFNLNINHVLPKGIYSIIHTDLNTELIHAQSIFNFHIILSIVILAAVIIAAIRLYKNHPLTSFSIFWFFIALAPVSNIIPQVFIMSERYLYIASFGFCLLLAYLFYRIKQKNIMLALFIIVILLFSGFAISRNNDFEDAFTFWSSAVEKSPGSALSHNNLGKVYFDRGDYDTANQHYAQAIELNPSHAKSYINLGISYASQGKLELAIKALKRAILLDPDSTEAHNNLGLSYLKIGEVDLAIEEFKDSENLNEALSIKSTNLGVEYKNSGNLSLAIAEYKKAIEYKQDNIIAHYNLANTYLEIGDSDSAIEEYQIVIDLKDSQTGVIQYDQETIEFIVEESRNIYKEITFSEK